MAKVIHYYAHPGHRFSHANKAMWDAAQAVEGVTRVDLYANYPRHNINIDKEQKLLLDHDVIVFQFPIFWYSAPSLLKEWIDLTLEHGFAYGKDGDKLRGKWMMLAVTAAGPEDAYSEGGYQHFSLRTFLTPFEQTARLSKMRFAAPYVFHNALRADPGPHAAGFADLLSGLRDDRVDLEKAEAAECLYFDSIPSVLEGA
ncbi:Kef-type potassium/proton antiporter accessory protein (CPA2 family) [Shimia isoporae]|uniref:Kef-type potassium/proton antiporter accessory protein (CPA2 family) n=1 Tax=Shimia isoporae TaxID=647720 RepID=A0A4R1N4P2_9RHOB|nr:NAD(P)H-dependent oxidoreductase [Shimia isoporae]TCK99253.1 Kef-type potassium/proton antiporter accessory protein (CPA2 family) [Shimia isoporae]